MRKSKAKSPQADATRCIHSGEERHGEAGPLTTPIAQTSVYMVPEVGDLRATLAIARGQYLYTRYVAILAPGCGRGEDCSVGGRGGGDCDLERHGGRAGCGVGGV